MSTFDDKYWNLAQASGWVLMRSKDYVERFGGLNPDSWSATLMYKETWPYPEVGEESELLEALQKGDLKAFGVRAKDPQGLEEIPTDDWEILTISPPDAYHEDPRRARISPWLKIRVKSADLRRLWPDPDAPPPPQRKSSGKNWDAVDAEINRLRNSGIVNLAEISNRQLAGRIVSALEKAYKDDPMIPKERSIRDRISRLRKTGKLPSKTSNDSA